jgi:hypothetical protein
MLQTDTSVASFWITHPTNDFVDTVAAGSDFYGIWYEIKEQPDGPSATLDACPMGNALGNVTNNTAHSNIRFGLRIFILAAGSAPATCEERYRPKRPLGRQPFAGVPFFQLHCHQKSGRRSALRGTGKVVLNNFIAA